MTRNSTLAVALALALALIIGPGAQAAQDEWKFGLGTGLSSFSLDGEIGLPGPEGGVIIDVDLDNGDTMDLLESGVGIAGYAARGNWKIGYVVGSRTLEDSDAGYDAEWDMMRLGVQAVYTFARPGNHGFGVVFGVRHIQHEWTFTSPETSVAIDESWTDVVVGIAHSLRFGGNWGWFNKLDAGAGGSEGQFLFQSILERRFGKHWAVNLNLGIHSIEFGEVEDIDESDFYLYDVDEPQVGLGFMYNW